MTQTETRPLTDVVCLIRSFERDALDVPGAHVLAIAPKEWPEDDKFCDIDWDKLEATLSDDGVRPVT